MLLVVATLFGGALLLSYALWSYPAEWTLPFSMLAGWSSMRRGILAGWTAAKLANRGNSLCVPAFSNVLWALPAGLFAGCEIYGLSFIVYHWKAWPSPTMSVWSAVSWGTPLLVMAFLLGRHAAYWAGEIRSAERNAGMVGAVGRLADALGDFLVRTVRAGAFAPRGAKVCLPVLWAKRAVVVAGHFIAVMARCWGGVRALLRKESGIAADRRIHP